MQSLFQTDSKSVRKEWASAFKAASKLKVWEILDNLIGGKKGSNSELELHRMAIRSLKMVESEFNTILPSNYESILYYLTTNYLCKVPGKYIKHSSIGPTWAIAFVLYRAGRKTEFYRYLSNP